MIFFLQIPIVKTHSFKPFLFYKTIITKTLVHQCSYVYYSAVVCTTGQLYVLQCSCMYYSAVVCTTVYLSVLQCSSMYYSAVVCTTVQLYALQCSCMYYSAVVCTAVQLYVLHTEFLQPPVGRPAVCQDLGAWPHPLDQQGLEGGLVSLVARALLEEALPCLPGRQRVKLS